jgi:hypothetical protein
VSIVETNSDFLVYIPTVSIVCQSGNYSLVLYFTIVRPTCVFIITLNIFRYAAIEPQHCHNIFLQSLENVNSSR